MGEAMVAGIVPRNELDPRLTSRRKGRENIGLSAPRKPFEERSKFVSAPS